jgi:hypothetical protein
MYSATIKPKVQIMFGELSSKVNKIVTETNNVNDAVNKITQLVSSEIASRSKTILSDMLFELNDSLMKTAFFADIANQNRFIEINIRQEILSKYHFSTNPSLDYKEASMIVQSLKIGGATLVIGGIGVIGIVLISGLSFSSLVPIPVSVLVAASLGAALVDCLAVEPNRSKKSFAQAVDKYLAEAQLQFLNWFDEVENHYNKRVEEIKRTM